MSNRKIDTRLDFLSPLSLIPGLGPKRVAALLETGLCNVGDLLYYFPRRYVDRSTITPVAELSSHIGQTCSVIGTITRTRVERGRRSRFRIQVTDDSGAVEALWFRGVRYFQKSLRSGKRVMMTGVASTFNGVQMVHPQIESIPESADAPSIPFMPAYPLTIHMRDAHLMQKQLQKAIEWVLNHLNHYPQILPERIVEKKTFPPLDECLKQIHLPDDPDNLDKYCARLKYEELYQLALSLRWSKRKFALPGRPMKAGDLVDKIRKALPFDLTDEQDKALGTLLAEAANKTRMHRILQGDVGSGKTIVSFLACLPAVNEGLQVAWLAPTEVLARQSHRRIQEWCEQLSVEVGLLTGSTPARDKRDIVRTLKTGELTFVVGTHALLQPGVTFDKLGMIVIDEQHKFGAEQRLGLTEKDPASDVLLMSATPIPQSLAQTIYSDLDLVTIRSLPKGRLPVRTHIVPEQKRADMESFLAKEMLENGGQVFYLVPRIESDEDTESDVRDIDTVVRNLGRGPCAKASIAAIHGRMSPEDKQQVMAGFAAGNTQLLVSTTLVEVGVDIPNATIMVIENAERFGLAQLHQLRGRVGRGTRQGYCFLLPQPTEAGAALERLNEFCATNDGFIIAELDLKLRGPGDVVGFRQSGWDDLKMADILRDAALFGEICEEIDSLLVR